MKTNIYIGVIVFLLGIVAGGLLLTLGSVEREEEPEIVIEGHSDTIFYSRLDLKAKTYKIDVPKISVKNYIYVQSDSVKVVYKDSIQYIMLPRQYYYTNTDDAEIWHSGIDSTIDSLNVVRKTEVITKTTQEPFKKNRLSLGAEVGYFTFPYIPIYLEYSRMLHRNVEFYVRALYDVPSESCGASVGAKLQVGW